MVRGIFPKILLMFLVAIAISSFVLAGPVSHKDATFYFNIDDSRFSEGDWRLYIISVGEFEKDGLEFSGYFEDIKSKYINFKQGCGNDETFYEEVYEMSLEEQQHKGCTINGTYQEIYCTRTATSNNACQELIPYKIDDNNNRLTFDYYYNSYMWDINRSDFYNHYDAYYCDIESGNCALTMDALRNPQNPFIIVLEKLDSDEAYFSSEITAPFVQIFDREEAFECPANNMGVCDIHIDVILTAKDFSASGNELQITFEPTHRNKLYKDGMELQSMESNALNIVFLIILIVSLALGIWTAYSMKNSTLSKILKGKKKFSQDIIIRTYYAIMVPIITFAIFGLFIWLLSQLLRP